MELKTIARLAKKMNVKPNIGIRIKLASSGSGKWEESGGDVSKFGVNSSELLDALDILEKNKMADSFSYRQSGDQYPSYKDSFERSFSVLCGVETDGI